MESNDRLKSYQLCDEIIVPVKKKNYVIKESSKVMQKLRIFYESESPT